MPTIRLGKSKIAKWMDEATLESKINSNVRMNRRSAIARMSTLAAGVASLSAANAAPETQRKSKLGIVMYDCGIRRNWMKQLDASSDLFSPFTFLKHCHSLGAGGAQVGLGVLDAKAANELRDYAEANNLFIEALINPPKSRSDLERFEAEVKTARDVGAKAARTVIIPGRRYEYFKTYAEFKESERLGQAMALMAAPVVEKHQVPLAIENHKDQRVEDRVALLERISSPYVGACVDTGNSFALLDDVYGAIEALAPFAMSVHFKDQALKEYDDGFLLGDIPLGQGSFDLVRMRDILRTAKPQLQFCLEVITRDALKVPCLTDVYWSTVKEPSGLDLARTLSFVRSHPVDSQTISSLPLVAQVEVEDANITESLAYASKELGL